MGWESTNVTGNWDGSGTGPVARSHHRAKRPVPEPFHCDHIARWSARAGTSGRSGTGVNVGAGCVPEPFRSQSASLDY